MTGRKRNRSPKMWFPLLLMGIVLFHASPNYANICKFCECTYNKGLLCSGVFWKGDRLRHALRNTALSHLNMDIPPSKITRDIFQGLQSTRALDLSRNGLSALDVSTFMNFSRLETLSLAYNHFENFPALRGLEFLNILLLNRNILREPPRHLRWTTPKVRNLQLHHNKLKSVSGIHLPQQLVKIDLSENVIRVIDSKSFKGLMFLEFVDLRNNRITEVGDQAFLSPVLDEVTLTGNDISFISYRAFSRSLHRLTLSGAHLLHLTDFTALSSMITLDIQTKVNHCSNAYFGWPQNLKLISINRVCNSERIPSILTQCPTLSMLSVTNGELLNVNLTRHSQIKDEIRAKNNII